MWDCLKIVYLKVQSIAIHILIFKWALGNLVRTYLNHCKSIDPLVITPCSWKSPLNRSFHRKITYTLFIFHCHVWLIERKPMDFRGFPHFGIAWPGDPFPRKPATEKKSISIHLKQTVQTYIQSLCKYTYKSYTYIRVIMFINSIWCWCWWTGGNPTIQPPLVSSTQSCCRKLRRGRIVVYHLASSCIILDLLWHILCSTLLYTLHTKACLRAIHTVYRQDATKCLPSATTSWKLAGITSTSRPILHMLYLYHLVMSK